MRSAVLSTWSRGDADLFDRLDLQARDTGLGLPTLDLGAGQAGLLVAAADRVAEGEAERPRRVIGAEDLPQHVAEVRIRPADDVPEEAVADQPRAAEAGG